MTKNSSGKHFWTKYISVLLAAFVFVAGMTVSWTAFSAGLQIAANASSKVDPVLKPVLKAADKMVKDLAKSLNDDICQFDFKVDGAKKFKINVKSKDEKYYTGTVEKGKNIKIHGIIKPVPIETLNQKYRKKGDAPYTIRKQTGTIKLQAKKDNKILKDLTKTYTDTLDCVMDYKVPKDATYLFISVYLSDYVSSVRKDDWWQQETEPPQVIVLTVGDSTAATDSDKQSTEKQIANDSSAQDSNGVDFVYLGGGIVMIAIGGYIGMHYIGGGAGAAGSMPEPPEPPEPEPEPPAPPEPDYFLYKDPAGFETLYMKDPETGQWYNYQDYEEGYRVPVDMDKLQEYDAQRQKDVKWNQDQMQKLENRETGLDKELKQEYQDMLEREKQIQEETKQDLIGLRTNTYGMSQEERRRVMEERQAKDQKDVDKWTKRADAWDTAMTVAEGVQTAADIGVDIMATVAAPVGGGYVADAYALTKNVAGCGMEGLVNKERTLVGGLAEGLTKGLIDAGQNHSTAKWQKYLSYVGGESIKGGIDAGLKGESIVKGAVKGALQGGTKLGVDAVGKKVGDKITKNSADSLKHAYEHAGDIRNRIAPQVSERSVKALQEMNLQKHLANMHKGEHQTLANTITQGITRNLLPKIFG